MANTRRGGRPAARFERSEGLWSTAAGDHPRRIRCVVANAIVYWNTIYIQRALDDLGHEPDSDELDGLTPTLFKHVNPLGTYDFNTDQPAGQLRPLRAASAA